MTMVTFAFYAPWVVSWASLCMEPITVFAQFLFFFFALLMFRESVLSYGCLGRLAFRWHVWIDLFLKKRKML